MLSSGDPENMAVSGFRSKYAVHFHNIFVVARLRLDIDE
jgi:hypothetical protein